MHQHSRLLLCIGLHRTADDPCVHKRQQAVDEHFATAIQALGKRFDATFAGN
ncbi:hypothetical protein D3C79_661340 [compost metagenome]